MTRHLVNYVLPTSFIERFRPVLSLSHPHEKALGGHFFDPNGMQFFTTMTTAETVTPEAIWTVASPTAGGGFGRVVSGKHQEIALGYIICQVPFAASENLEFTLRRRLTYRARIRIATLQALLDDIRQAGQLADGSEIAAFIQHRIEGLKI